MRFVSHASPSPVHREPPHMGIARLVVGRKGREKQSMDIKKWLLGVSAPPRDNGVVRHALGTGSQTDSPRQPQGWFDLQLQE
jgi:hypothetical protein